MIEKAFEIISSKVEKALTARGFARVGVTNVDSSEIVSLFTSEAVAYSVVYYKRKKHMVLETCAMTDDGPDNDWKTLSTWMFDPERDTEKEAESIRPPRAKRPCAAQKRRRKTTRAMQTLCFFQRGLSTCSRS